MKYFYLPALCPLMIICLLIGASPTSFAQGNGTSRSEYLDYTEGVAQHYIDQLAAYQKKWREEIMPNETKGYKPPSNEIYLAALCANLYELTGKEQYLQAATKLLLKFGDHKNRYPKDFFKVKAEYSDGLPALPNIFCFGKYVHAYAVIKKSQTLSDAEDVIIKQNIAEGADYLMVDQEWGPMNRAMLRAEGLLYATKMLPNHPRQAIWKMMGTAILDDNLGKWNIEDASLYNAIWLYSLTGYVNDVSGDESINKSPVMTYYYRYFLSLLSPAYTIPDFGDAKWNDRWYQYVAFFENGARTNRDPNLRWAAARMFQENLDTGGKSIYIAMSLSDACRWADFDMNTEPPSSMSQEVLEDVVGKKMVFRNGWDANSTYMLLNYRDEGDGGWLYRENLRNTITVEEEKMHHGHADENSIVLLMKNKSILLHDAGYRDLQPSGPLGAYRADYFHNRLVVRKNKIALGQQEGQHVYSTQEPVAGQSLLSFLQNSGAYRQVKTLKIDFLNLTHFDMSRTRIIDEKMGYIADRIINYVKDLDYFVIYDIVRFTDDDFLTMANLWHSRKIVGSGENWYDTEYDSLGNNAVKGEERLLIYFPYNHRLTNGIETQVRHKQKEKTIYQVIGRHGYPNDLQAFVTILIPHHKNVKPENLVKQIQWVETDKFPGSVAVAINTGEKRYVIAAKLDMQSDLVRDWRRPKYTWETGKVRYGDYETDANNLFVVEAGSKTHYAIVGATKITHKDKVLHEQQPRTYKFSMDGSPDKPGIGKLRYWEDAIELR
ncbi:MAG TPA: hypothetical protein EYN89_02265 [Flavobacteriales bacterium]|nr:hypothetical protein [Flavobacteriales bacterium]